MTDQEFCEIENQIEGNNIDVPEQIARVEFTGRELKEYLDKAFAIHGVVQAKPEKANLEVLAIMGTLVRTLSRLDNLNPELLNDTDKRRLLKGKETLTEWCKIDLKDIPRPQ